MEVVHEGTLQLEPAWGEGHADLARRWGHPRGKKDWPACKDARHGLLRWGAVGIVVVVCWETWSQGMASRKKKHTCLALGRREEKARRLGWLAIGLKLDHCSRDVQASHKGKRSSQASRGRWTLLGCRWAFFWASFAMQ